MNIVGTILEHTIITIGSGTIKEHIICMQNSLEERYKRLKIT